MLIEAESIPYEPAQLRGERLLVLAPHPDDEVIGCGGLVAQHLREGRRVRVVIATDGAAAGEALLREEESRRGLARLGGNAEVEFLRFRDRALTDEAAPAIRAQLADFQPDLILVPGPIEIHPDHLALSQLFCNLVQRDEALFADLAVSRVAFYEVGQPLRPNAIVDISDVADAKWAAIAEHASQLATRDYLAYARGLNAYRAMTLPAGTAFAEAYFVVGLPELRTTAFSTLRKNSGAPRDLQVSSAVVPLSVVIRTKDRPALLREAIASVQATGYPCEIVVVDDGGSAPETLEGVAANARVVRHETSRGRSEAANAGAQAAQNAFLVFLDDDDLFYPEHLSTLTTAAATPHLAWYTDAVSSFLRPSAEGAYEEHARLRLFAQDFDRELLLLDNYIPLPTLLVARETFLDAGGFDPAFDLFEDWDFLIRLSQRGSFLHVPRVTCEVRHFEGGSSIVLAAHEGTERFRRAKLQVWQKHAALIDNDVIANVFERQKSRTNALFSDVAEVRGQRAALQNELAREQRQGVERQNDLNGYRFRVRELEGSLTALQSLVPLLDEKSMMIEHLRQENARLEELHTQARTSNDAAGETIRQLRVEIDRLNGLLQMIYGSRTWKLHNLAEKLRGRG